MVQAKNQNLRRVTQTQLKLNNNLNAAMGELKEAMTKLEKKKEFDMKREASSPAMGGVMKMLLS